MHPNWAPIFIPRLNSALRKASLFDLFPRLLLLLRRALYREKINLNKKIQDP